jgi:hypothetical protein
VLKTLDILIGVATVMLLFSMAVTVGTQAVISTIRARGRNLRDGLAALLRQIDPDMDNKIAEKISTALLTHPLIAGKFGALGTVIHREELTTLLMELAAGQAPTKVESNVKTAIVQLLKKNGVDDPAGALKNIRDVALQLEAANPLLSNAARHSLAILQEASSEYVAKIHGWFDQTIDRVSQRFTAVAHGITFVVALVVAFSVQLDTIALVNRLSSDDAMRGYLVKRANDLAEQAKTNPGLSGGTAEVSPTPTPTQNPQDEITEALQKNGLIAPPQWPFTWKKEKTGKYNFEWRFEQKQVLGILLSALLLSLGAPFWYSALQSLLKLRSPLAEKDDKQRASRQAGPGDGGAAVAVVAAGGSDGSATDGAALPASFKGEQGDLKAMG